MDEARKFGEQTSRILEFKPEGLDFQLFISYKVRNVINVKSILLLVKNKFEPIAGDLNSLES